MVPCFGSMSGLSKLLTGNVCQPCDSDNQCLGHIYLGYCNPQVTNDSSSNSTNKNDETYNQCLIRTLLASGSHLESRQGKCQVSRIT